MATLAVTTVVAVPLFAATAVAVMFLRAQAESYDSAPVRRNALCVGGIIADSVLHDVHLPGSRTGDAPRASYGHRYELGAYALATRPTRSGDVVVRGLPDADKVLISVASYDSTAHVPVLSIWPFTDPDDTDYRIVRDSGETLTSYFPLQPEDAEAIAEAQRTLSPRVLMLAGGFIGLCALVGGAVWTATGRLLRPVEAIRRELAEITDSDLARRVPTPRGRTELTRLAEAVNATLGRLQIAAENNRRFVADASHELRSPIAALRAELEIATAHPRQADWPAVVDAALIDTERLQHLAGDLLLLARLDHTTTIATAGAAGEILDLITLVRDHTARRRSRHVVTVVLPERPARVHGRRALLERLLGNLLDNAERHATTTITVHVAVADDHVVLEVLDDGPGISPRDGERVFNRFTRLDDARTRDTGGTGLGLPIARRIATAHAATLHVADHPTGGAHLIATFPAAP
ncbi:HAMP domain-containing sensor histidine kinase [Actinosynnema sp. NPDC023587]|uniref:sensor histidine kinase n=1 Tax=Actinosynnema sp. NPDC023587 TaxID=3154695 RepID=UPI00340E8F7F